MDETHIPPSPSPEMSDDVLAALRAADRPLTAKELGKRLTGSGEGTKRRPGDIETELQAGTQAGRAFRWPGKGADARYWDRNIESFTEQHAGALLAEGDLSWSKLTSALAKNLPGVSPEEREQVLDRLVTAGRLHRVGRGRSAKVSRTAPDVVALLRKRLGAAGMARLTRSLLALVEDGVAIERIFDGLRQHLESAAEAVEPATEETTGSSEAEVERLLLKGMTDLNPDAESGAPVALDELRRTLPAEYRAATVFDRVVNRLVSQGRVVANWHDRPDELSEQQRGELVRDEQGRYLTSIAQKVRAEQFAQT